jgi:hypothetical protein
VGEGLHVLDPVEFVGDLEPERCLDLAARPSDQEVGLEQVGRLVVGLLAVERDARERRVGMVLQKRGHRHRRRRGEHDRPRPSGR